MTAATRSAPHTSSESTVDVFHLYPQALADEAVRSAALMAARSPLADVRPDERPGVYILFVNQPAKPLERYGAEITAGTFPIYVGSAQLLPKRLNRHRQTIASASGLEVGSFSVSMIYTDSLASALAVEQTLIKLIRPPWNERAMSGFGSAPQGERRLVQRPSGFDCLHRRNWAPTPSAKERATARAALKLYLESGYVRPLWPELTLAKS